MRGISNNTKVLIDFANEILEEDNPQTLRQLHYRIFSAARISDYENDVASYRRLCRQMTTARRAYREWELGGSEGDQPPYSVDWEYIVDELRKPETVSLWTDAAEYIDCVRDSYRRDNWQDQPEYIELWGEKATVLGAMRPITSKWGIVLRVCRGFGSSSMENQVGDLFEGINKPITVLYVGDHDPSGRLIETDMHDRVETASGVKFKIKRIAIHKEDIKRYNLPPQKIKEKDMHDKAAKFRKRFGEQTVELEALPSTVLKARVDKAIRDHIQFDRWDQQTMVQNVELKCIAKFADTIKNLPQLQS